MTATTIGLEEWSLDKDKDGYRVYTAKWLVGTDDVLDGPFTITGAAGLPVIGSTWTFGNDNDTWALCWPDWKVSPYIQKERTDLWYVTQTFTNKPLSRCQDTDINDPLAEPFKISGSFQKYTKHAARDKDGNPLRNSCFEIYTDIDIDESRPTVSISWNVLNQPLSTFSALINYLNDAPLWGLGERCVKLTNATWDRKLYGSCYYYYALTLEFDIRFDTFDEYVIDYGSRVLVPGGNVLDQDDFEIKKDRRDENMKVLLDGAGGVLAPGATPYSHQFKVYKEGNLLLLGIPTSL